MEYWKKWGKAAAIRAARTFAEAVLVYIGGDAVRVGELILSDVNWAAAVSAGIMGAVIAVLIALAGLPEVPRIDTQPDTWREDLDDPEG